MSNGTYCEFINACLLLSEIKCQGFCVPFFHGATKLVCLWCNPCCPSLQLLSCFRDHKKANEVIKSSELIFFLSCCIRTLLYLVELNSFFVELIYFY